MTGHLDLTSRPAEPAPAPLVAVDRAIAELRRGGIAAVTGAAGATLVLAAEAVTDDMVARLAHASGAAPDLAVTGRRAAVLGLTGDDGAGTVVRLSATGGLSAADVARLSDPCAADSEEARALVATLSAIPTADDGIRAAIALTKLARLLPAALVAPCGGGGCSGVPGATAAEIAGYEQAAARTLRVVSEARVPLQDAEQTRIVAFRPSDGGIEHLAIVIGEPDPDQPVLARLHSECFTGDLLGSLRCDCGDQLRGAIGEIARAGSGVLLYLAQEGRGIGLVNKLRAYQLQDDGFDTLDANLQLGFDDDERIYQPAAQMLRLLGVGRVRLMTNNPAKVDALARHGIDVIERVPHIFPANDHNALYLRTKATRSGHLF
jgi:GTP cyclohydrolase II